MNYRFDRIRRQSATVSIAFASFAALLVVLAEPAFLLAQPGETDEVVTRAYPLDDLLRSAIDYQFQGINFPALNEQNRYQRGMPGGFGGGSAGGGGGGLGGGTFRIPDVAITNTRFTAPFNNTGQALDMGGFITQENVTLQSDDIINAVTELVEMADEAAWDNGGITQLGETMIVRTTASNHRRIEELLKMFRDNVARTSRSVTVLATWLLIDDADFATLNATTTNGVRTVDREQVAQLAISSGGSGSLTCIDGQTVHMVSGNVRNWIKSVVPVVGDASTPAGSQQIADRAPATGPSLRLVSNQVEHDTAVPPASQTVGYQPVTATLNYGAMLQVTPMLVHNEESALIDVHSNVVLPTGDQKTVGAKFVNIITLDRLDVTSHQFKTSLNLPLGTPAIVGGSTLQVGQEKARQLLLIIEVVARK